MASVPDSYENGEGVNEVLNNTCLNKISNDIETKGDETCFFQKNDVTKEKKILPYAYPEAPCSHFAVLNKPDVNKSVFRGCNKDGVCDLEGMCGAKVPFTDFYQYLSKCQNNAPGGLANFETDMDNNADVDLYANGFIMNDCECRFRKFEDYSNANYFKAGPSVIWPNQGKYRCSTKYNCLPKTEDNLNGYGLDQRISGEIWEGYPQTKCNTLIDMEKKDESNPCSQYLIKWAETCKWCKNVGNIKAGDAGYPCYFDDQCLGECKVSELDPDKRICSYYYKPECKICDSKLWDHIPGGWEAIVDPENRFHDVAKLSYVPKLQKTDEITDETFEDIKTCGQPVLDAYNYSEYNNRGNRSLGRDTVSILGGTVTGWIPDLKETEGSTYICDAGPFKEYNRVGIPGLELPTTPILISEWNQSWPNNKCDNVCCGCGAKSGIDWNYSEDEKPIYRSTQFETDTVWDREKKSSCPSLTEDLPKCEARDLFINSKKNLSTRLTGDSARIMCKRNPVLTGTGNSFEENNKLAKNWIKGKLDLSEYGGPKEYYPYTKEEVQEHKVEAMRCCLGLNPKPQYKGSLVKDETNTRNSCMPATLCGSSDVCKDLFKEIISDESLTKDFGLNYPEGYKLNGDSNLSKETMYDLSYYAKAYCEMLSGGNCPKGSETELMGCVDKITTGNCGYDKEVNTLCRKALYNYYITPVTVKVNEEVKNKYILEEYKLPLRIFTDEAFRWCTFDLKKVAPNNYGVCDMLMSRACQQLQADGWIDPRTWGEGGIKDPLLEAFVNDSGQWVEIRDDGTEVVHNNLDQTRIRKVCGCFLMGAECGNTDCSYFYCGSGTNSNLGPGKVNMDTMDRQSINWDTNSGNDTKLNKRVETPLYKGSDNLLPRWKSEIESDFTCYDENGSTCFKDCNYVNFNDTCWNASPTQRNVEVFNSENNGGNWVCKSQDNNDSCKAYNDEYGCFGQCFLEYPDKYNCGTKSWFNEDANLNPKEKETKLNPNNPPGRSSNWTNWGNYYTFDRANEFGNAPGNVFFDVPGFGRTKMYDDTDRNKSNLCNKLNGIKPYGNKGSGNNLECKISQIASINNQGTISANSINITNEAALNCISTNNIDADQRNKFFSDINSNNDTQQYIRWMGQKNCNDDIDCLKTSQICIDANTGDNCMICGESDYGLDSPQRSRTCCVSDLLKPENEQPLCFSKTSNPNDINICKNLNNENDCNNNSDICRWETKWENDNNKVIQILGNDITYFCDTTCPPGTKDLRDLQINECGKLCQNNSDPISCNNCKFCTWKPEELFKDKNGKEIYLPPGCVAQCLPQSREIEQLPTPEPTVPPVTTLPPLKPEEENNKLWIIIGSVVGGIILIVSISLGVYFNKSKKKLKLNK